MAYEENKSEAAQPEDSQAAEGKKAVADHGLLVKMRDFFSYALDHPVWVGARKMMTKCHDYNEGKQWTDEEEKELEKRKQPNTATNLVSVTVNKLVGDLVDQRVRIGFRGRSGEQDALAAQDLSDIFLHIRQSNDLEFEEREMARDGFISGFGCIEAFPTFDDLFQPEIKVQSEDSLVVFPDPDAKRYDWNEDAKFICRPKWMDAEEAKEKYPKAKAGIAALMGENALEAIAGGQLSDIESFRKDDYVDQKRKRVRMIEVQYKKYKRECVYFTGQGVIPEEQWNDSVRKQLDAENIGWEKIDRIKPTICIGLFGAGMVIDHKETPRKYFSLVPYWVYRKKDGAPYSLVALALSMQDAINKRDSKALHLMSTNQTIAERNALKDKDLYAEELAKPDGIPIVEDGALAQEKILLRNNLELAQGQMQMHQQAIQTFYAITGINPNVVAQTGEIRSGSGLKTKFAEASKPIAAIFDNLKRSRKILGRVILDLVQIYYTKEKVFLVTDSPEAAERQVTITADKMARIKQMAYDVVVDDFEDHATVQQEQWALWMQYLPQLIQAGPFWQKQMLRASDLRDKDAIIKELEASGQPPPIAPRISVQANIDALSPPERAFFYQQMGNPELAAQVVAMDVPTTTEVKVTADLAKAKIQADTKSQQPTSQGA